MLAKAAGCAPLEDIKHRSTEQAYRPANDAHSKGVHAAGINTESATDKEERQLTRSRVDEVCGE